MLVKLSIKLSTSLSQRQKILRRLWSKNFELQSAVILKNQIMGLSIIAMFLTIYGVGKLHCDRSTQVMLGTDNNYLANVSLISPLKLYEIILQKCCWMGLDGKCTGFLHLSASIKPGSHFS